MRPPAHPTTALYGADCLQTVREDDAEEASTLDKVTSPQNLPTASHACSIFRFANALPLPNIDSRNSSYTTAVRSKSESTTALRNQNSSGAEDHSQQILAQPKVSMSAVSTSGTIITTFTTRIHTITLPRPSSNATTLRDNTTGSNSTHQKDGNPNTNTGPSRASLVFWAGYMIILLAVLVCYIGFTIYLLVREYPKGRKQRQLRAARAAQAAKEAVGSGEGMSSSSSTNRLEPRLIKSASKRVRLSTQTGLAGAARRMRTGHYGFEELGDSYEMDDLGKRAGRQRERRNPSTGAGSSGARVREARGGLANGRETVHTRNEDEAGIWSGLNARNIDEVDETTRVTALRQMREVQTPIQTNLGDNNEWPLALSKQEHGRLGGGNHKTKDSYLGGTVFEVRKKLAI